MKRALSVLAFLLLVGCAHINVGADLAAPKVDRIVKGQSTKEQVTEILGEPMEKQTEAGVERWTYVNRLTSASPKLTWLSLGYRGDVKEKRLVVVFDHNLVKAVSVSETVKPFVSTVGFN